jgi:hypothetical protein
MLADSGFVSAVTGPAGTNGIDGWTPIFGIISDGDRRVLKVIDWIGGGGVKPDIGYVTSDGLTGDISSATDIRGPVGDAGAGVPAGGSGGQVLTKIDSTDYNTQWS